MKMYKKNILRLAAKDDVKKRTMEVDDERKCPSGVHATKMGPEDFQLHVQSDHSTGGHWCAKIFFFTLLVILLGLICLIIMENRGLDDRKLTICAAVEQFLFSTNFVQLIDHFPNPVMPKS